MYWSGLRWQLTILYCVLESRFYRSGRQMRSCPVPRPFGKDSTLIKTKSQRTLKYIYIYIYIFFQHTFITIFNLVISFPPYFNIICLYWWMTKLKRELCRVCACERARNTFKCRWKTESCSVLHLVLTKG